MHQPGADVLVGNADAPCPPSSRHLIAALLGITVEHRSVASGWRVILEMFLVGSSIVRPITGSQVPIMLAVGVHGMIFEDARRAGVAEPDYVQYLSDFSREGSCVRVPSVMFHGGVVIGRSTSGVRTNEIGLVMQVRRFFVGPGEIIVTTIVGQLSTQLEKDERILTSRLTSR